jgi:hypothetical protein
MIIGIIGLLLLWYIGFNLSQIREILLASGKYNAGVVGELRGELMRAEYEIKKLKGEDYE